MTWSTVIKTTRRRIMIVKNNYERTLTNIAASIQGYFGVPQYHKSLPVMDGLLAKNNPENVVIILLDGMGSNILERTLPEKTFFRQNLVENLTTVFPATTAAATSSIRTGLNPAEHGWTGWTGYIEPIDKVITLFLNTEKGDDENICEEYLKVKHILVSETVTDQINKSGNGKSLEIMPFGNDAYVGLDAMLEKIENEVKKPGKKYIYAYDDEPDTTMHNTGPDSEETKALIKERNDKICQLASKIHDTLLIIIADHGHIKTKTLYLEDYPDILELMTHKTSMDQRAAVFKIQPGKKQEFRRRFERHFGEFYDLYDAEEVIKAKLFGDGAENPLFRGMLGDFLAIAKTDVAITAPGDHFHISHHAGYTDDELKIPVIAKYIK